MSITDPSSQPPPLKANPQKKPLTFGDFVAGVYRAWGERQAKGIIQLAVKARLVEFRGTQRIEIP